ncbi:Uncharacterized protein BM_BM17858 [Brugia malayi]|uniref:DNA polymerase III beta sliding clamp N-terminal domain-containing protein n=1 Tax=Brugia malayi TaxID=6279 RepID=A0A4E9FR28_BRUMA|nr:Uncharacterized protein BM_BM17858 [Brugia malayi]VIO99604.1 Uncharacterized protein BM_BM17858 [Brugia malayi]
MWHGNSSHAAVFDNNKDLIDFSKARAFGFEMASLLKDPVALGIGRTNLLSTLSRVSGVVERRNAIDILACINIKAQHGSIKLMATDLDISIFASLAADVSTEGEVKVSAHTLHDIVKKLPADLNVNFEAYGYLLYAP